MPYIPAYERANINNGAAPETPGQLAYKLTRIVLDYKEGYGSDYQGLSSIVGVLECVKQEFIRQAINPYEDYKIERNGGLKW